MKKSIKKESLINAFQINFSEIGKKINRVGVKNEQFEENKLNIERKNVFIKKIITPNLMLDPENNPMSDPISDPISDIMTNTMPKRSTDHKANNKSQWDVNLLNKTEMPRLTKRQYAVLKFIYFNRPFKVAGKNNSLSCIYNMGRNNARNQLKSLENKGYIYKPYSVNDGITKGSTCRINESKCIKLFGPTRMINPSRIKEINNLIKKRITRPQINQLYDPQTKHEGNWTKKTTNILEEEDLYTTATKILKIKKPEINYWINKGLSKKILSNWLKITSCKKKEMCLYLSYCYFEMTDLKREKKEPIRNVLNWFFKMIEKTGRYPKPQTYKSYEEKILERKEQELKKQKKIAIKEEHIYRELIKAKINTNFFKMMQEPGSKNYQKCFNMLNNFAKKTKNRLNKDIFETSMKEIFKKLIKKGEIKLQI